MRRFRTLGAAALSVILLGLASVFVAGPAHAAPALHSFGPEPIDPMPARQPQTTCDPVERPGVADFATMLTAQYGRPHSGIIRACGGPTSEHFEGRALDYPFDVNSDAERAQAGDVIAWLLKTDDHGNQYAMLRRLGIMYIIWNRQIWHAWAPYWQSYDGQSPHTDHIHFSFTWDGADKQTSFWRGSASREIAVVSQSGSGVDAFWRTAGGMGHRWYSGRWYGPEAMPVGHLGSPPSAVRTNGRTLDVFWKGTDNNLWHRVFNGTAWLPIENLRMGPLGGAPQAVGQANGTVDVFWRGTDNQLYRAFYNPGHAWSGPHAMGGRLASDPAPVVTAAGVVDVLWRGDDHNLWHSYYTGGRWYGAQSLGMGPLYGPPRAVGQSDGTVDVFWTGSDKALWHAFYQASTGWHGPVREGGCLRSDPAPTVSAPTVVDVFFKDCNDNLAHKYYTGGRWHGPESLGMGPLGGGPAAVGQPNGTVDVFWRGTNAGVFHAFYNPGHPWTGPENVGGSVVR